MPRIGLLLSLLISLLLAGCSRPHTRTVEKVEPSQGIEGQAEILQTWQGDYPVAQLDQIPKGQTENAVGYLNDGKTFHRVWKAFKPGEEVPDIDFQANLVLFARNTQFYNRISIITVKVTNGVAEMLAMETRSAMPIRDKVAMSMVVVARKEIQAIQTGDRIIQVNNQH